MGLDGAIGVVTVPAGVVPGFGGLSLEVASTAMVGLGEGARYVIEYPYGCAEQRSSRALASRKSSPSGPILLPCRDRTTKSQPRRGYISASAAGGRTHPNKQPSATLCTSAESSNARSV